MILRPKSRNQFLFLIRKAKHDYSCRTKHLVLTLWWPLTNKITGTQYHHKLILYSSCQVPRRVLGGATSGTGNNQGRQRTTPCNNRGFNRNGCHSKSTDMSLPVISVSLPLNNSVINPPQMSSVCQHSKSNELSSPVMTSRCSLSESRCN